LISSPSSAHFIEADRVTGNWMWARRDTVTWWRKWKVTLFTEAENWQASPQMIAQTVDLLMFTVRERQGKG